MKLDLRLECSVVSKLEKQITENSFFEIIQGSLNDKYLRLEYKQ